MRILSIILLTFMFLNCTDNSATQTLNSEEQKELGSFKKLSDSSRLNMVDDTEPGEKLMLCLTFVDKKTKAPLKNQKVLFYQTSEDGNYHPKIANDEKTARISGSAFTDDVGRIFINTILPGSYATSGDNRHIHTQVFDARPEAYDIHFKQYTSARMARFIEERDQFFLVDIKHTKEKKLIGFLTITVKNPKQ